MTASLRALPQHLHKLLTCSQAVQCNGMCPCGVLSYELALNKQGCLTNRDLAIFSSLAAGVQCHTLPFCDCLNSDMYVLHA